METKEFWISTPDFTVSVSVKNHVIQAAAPIVAWAKGLTLLALKRKLRFRFGSRCVIVKRI